MRRLSEADGGTAGIVPDPGQQHAVRTRIRHYRAVTATLAAHVTVSVTAGSPTGFVVLPALAVKLKCLYVVR